MLVVQKYGGTSMGDCERIKNVAKRVSERAKRGEKLVVVVSAMSGETDRLLNLTKSFSNAAQESDNKKSNNSTTSSPKDSKNSTEKNTDSAPKISATKESKNAAKDSTNATISAPFSPSKREVDMVLSSGERITSALLAIALESMGFKAISLSGRGAGIITESQHTKARIKHINTTAIENYLKEGYIVVVAGFQGVDEKGEVTTLGRGGSDLSAVALAGALKADLCEIFSDVDGVYTTDPRIEPGAKKIDKISYDEMLELASMGAKVLLNRSVELAKKLRVKLISRSSFSMNEGTMITDEADIMEKPVVSGVALDRNQARVSIADVADRPGIAGDIFGALAAANINVDMIVQTIGRDGKTDIDFTIPANEVDEARAVLAAFNDAVESIEYDTNIAKVSVVGVGMKSHSGVASAAFQALAESNINIMMISTSEIKISVVINAKYAELAVRSLHEAYKLDK